MVEIWSGKGSGGLAVPVPLFSAPVVDDQRDSLQAVALAQSVLQEEAVVAGQPGAVVDLDGEARRANVVLRHVDQLEPLATDVRRLAGGLDVGDEAIQLRGRYALAGLVGEVERLSNQPLDA